MGNTVVTGGLASCSFGLAPTPLTFLPTPRVMVEGRPVGRITDIVPMLNVAPFGMCTTLSNPAVAAATTAALGVLTPMPCVPAIAGPWKPGATKTLVGGVPALEAGSTCQCAYGGVIQITMPGSTKTQAT